LIVLTAGQYWKPPDPDAARQLEEFHEAWLHQLQPKLARLSTNGKQIVVETSDHSIPEHAPAAIVAAINAVVSAVRDRKN
jgi:N-formylglutamate amidohydrolase